jgi:hypothetical protein
LGQSKNAPAKIRNSTTLEYLDQNEQSGFKLNDKRDLIQYATFYFKRLSLVKDYVYQQCKKKWCLNGSGKRGTSLSQSVEKEGTDRMTIMNNILDIQPGSRAIIIGTLYKEMSKKPCIITNGGGVAGVLGKANKNYCSDDDYIVLEDSSGRIKIKTTNIVHPSKFITGSVLGLKGTVDQNGNFEAEDYTYADFNPDHLLPLPDSVDLTKEIDLKDPDRDYIAFVSGL